MNQGALPVYAIGNFGSSESLQDLLTQAYGNLAGSITSVKIAYYDYSYLQSITDVTGKPAPFSFWDPTASSASDVTQVWENGQTIGESSDPSGTLNYVTVDSAHFKDVSISIGDNIMPNVFLQVQMAPNSDGTAPAVQELQVGAIAQALDCATDDLNRAAHFGQPTPADIVTAAEYVAGLAEYVPNANDCHWIAMDIAALAGAPLDAGTWSADPTKNHEGGFWRIVPNVNPPCAWLSRTTKVG
jgi:hypothetical protein